MQLPFFRAMLGLICVIICIDNLGAQLLVEEFDYSGNLTANGWTAHSGGGTSPIATTTGLTYTDYPNSGTGNAALVTANGEDINLGFTSVNSGSIYVSFLVNVTSNHTAGDYFFHLTSMSGASPGSFVARVTAVDEGANHEFSFDKVSSGAQMTNLNISDGTTTLIVLKYTFITGTSNDNVSIFIFPAGGSYPSTEPSPTFSTSMGTDASAIAGVCLRQTNTNSDIIVDGIHVATSWAIALPISISSFNIKPTLTSTLLSFSTATEINNSHFVIERSADARTFSEIGRVQGAGTTRVPQSYTFTDEKPLSGLNYYRLRQVDFDGAESLSGVVSVVFGKAGSITIAPSPATDRVRIQLDEALTNDGLWQVFDNMGRQVLSGGWEAESADFELDVNTLPEGMYTFRLAVGTQVQVKQFRKL